MKRITIIGGGLAGLTLGIALRRRAVEVTIWEAGCYPRHRVCGEFISGHGLEVLASLGLVEPLVEGGAIRANTVSFFANGGNSPPRALARSALCLSRFTMDGLLAEEFRRLGGELRQNQRWQGDAEAEGIVRASGRRLDSQPQPQRWRWFGLKVHARGVSLTADLEMHALRNGYVGLCRLRDDTINVCGLFRRQPGLSRTASQGRELLRGEVGSMLSKRLAKAVFDESSFCAVAGLSLHGQRAAEQGECCIGDAITMIPPVTGNGMSMAFESAAIAVEPLARHSRGELSWNETRALIARLCDQTFRRRLLWARWLQRLMFCRVLQGSLAPLVLHSNCFWRLMFSHTR